LQQPARSPHEPPPEAASQRNGSNAMCLGIPGRIIRITDAERKLAMVDVSGVQREVNVACVVEDGRPVEDCIGYWVLIHVGFAMSRIDAEEAAQTLQILIELGEAQSEIESMRLSAAE
jgi:hydrogenase expression/formation protein HypC